MDIIDVGLRHSLLLPEEYNLFCTFFSEKRIGVATLVPGGGGHGGRKLKVEITVMITPTLHHVRSVQLPVALQHCLFPDSTAHSTLFFPSS